MSFFDNMRWSFSRLSTYEKCPYAFYLQYVEKRKDGESNWYAENGSACHKVIENLLKHKIKLEEAGEYYLKLLKCCEHEENESTIEKCLNYFANLEPLDEKYEILGVEKKINFKIGSFQYVGACYKFIGICDIILKDTTTDEIILVDNKSSDCFFGKKGSVLKAQEENFETYKKQMYLYCKAIKDEMGLTVNKIVWNHFKDDGKLSVIDFNEQDYWKTLEWATSTIEKIKSDSNFECNKSFIFCHRLCNYRNNCEYLEEDEE